MKVSSWKSAVVSTGDTASAEVDLGDYYRKLQVLIPTLTATTVTVHVSNESGGTFYPVHAFDADATGSFAHTISSGNGGIAVVFDIGGVTHIKVVLGVAEASDTTFRVRAID